MQSKKRKEESFSPKKVRRKLIIYMLRKYGSLRTKEIAKVLGFEPQTIRRTLKDLEDSNKVESDKLGKTYTWTLSEENGNLMYF